MSRTAIVGSPPLSRTHFLAPSMVKKAPNSVPANSRLGLTGSSAKASTGPFSGRSPAIEFQDVSVERRGLILRYRVRSPDFSHHRQLVAVGLARQVRADQFPGVAPIIAAKQLVGGEVDPAVGIWADDKRRIPVPTQRRLALALLRLN